MQSAWVGTDLPRRPCDLTYCVVPATALPTLEETLDGSLRWLVEPEKELGWPIGGPEADRIFDPSTVQRVRDACAAEGLGAPPALESLLTSPRRNWIRSPTACYLELSDGLVDIPGVDARGVRFLNDQQGVYFWYAVLGRSGDHGVVVSNDLLDADDWLDDPSERVIYRCAATVEEFLYRFWVETEIYFRSMDGESLTPVMEQYLEALR
jgi:hypothetical protein